MFNFVKRLNEALTGHQSIKIVEAARKYRQAKILVESKAPQQGAFWFVPNGSNWDIYSFFESNYPNTDHSMIWSRYLSKIIFDKPSIELRNAYAGLPRGRVVKLRDKYIIYFGNDLPNGKSSLKIIGREFNLPKYSAVFEEHEQMIPEHYWTIKHAIGGDYKLKEPPRVDFGDDDYDDWDDDEDF